MEQLEQQLRKKRPALTFKADYKNSRSAAIRAYCLSCMNNQPGEVSKCSSVECFLWPFRHGTKPEVRPTGKVLSEEEYQEVLDGSVSDAKREHARKMGLARRNG